MSLSRLSPEELEFLERLAMDERPALISMAMERELTRSGYLRNVTGQLQVTTQFRVEWALWAAPELAPVRVMGAGSR